MKVESTALASGQIHVDTSQQASIKKSAQDFEALFLGQIMKDMRRTIPEGGLFGNRPEEQMMRDLLDEEWGRQLAAGRGMGLAEVLFRQLQSET